MPSKKYRNKYPIRYTYQTLKDNAKRRGKSFNLTFEQFKQFAIKTDYLNVKGITKTSYHIDRIDENKGYTIDNIQLLTNEQNIKKYFDHYYDESIKKYVFKYKTIKPVETTNAPF